jgi:hypothetical protein
MGHEPWWHTALAVGGLLFFTAYGVKIALRPDAVVPRSLWRQGEMERTMNRDGVRVVGVVMAVGSLWVIYNVLFE